MAKRDWLGVLAVEPEFVRVGPLADVAVRRPDHQCDRRALANRPSADDEVLVCDAGTGLDRWIEPQEFLYRVVDQARLGPEKFALFRVLG